MAGAAGMVGMAWFSSSSALLCGVTVTVMSAVAAFGLARLFRRRDGKAEGASLAVILAVAVTLVGLGAARSVTISRDPPAAASPIEPGLVPLVLHDGSRLAYRKYDGPGAGTLAPIVVLHGGPGVPPLKRSFDFYGRLAESGRTVYVYEQIGVGQSSRLEDMSSYTLQRNIDDLEELRTAIGAPRIVLIGQSWGAILASYYMAQHPNGVERAVLMSPGAFRHGGQYPNDYSHTALSERPTGVHGPFVLGLAGLLAHVNPGLVPLLADQAELGRAYDAFRADPASAYGFNCRGYQPDPALLERDRGANYAVLLMSLASLERAPDPAPALHRVEAPVLILRGECDFVPRAVAEDYAEVLPNARIADIAGAGHMAPDAKPEEVLTAISAFLAMANGVIR